MDYRYSKSILSLGFSHLATYLEAASIMHAKNTCLSLSSTQTSPPSHEDKTDDCSPFPDILQNKMRDVQSHPNWRRRIRHLVRTGNDRAFERSFTRPLPQLSIIALISAWLAFVTSFLWSIGLRWDLPLFCGLICLGCMWPAFAFQHFDEGRYHRTNNVLAPALGFSVLWWFALASSGAQVVFYCLLVAFLWHRVVVYRRCAWATRSRYVARAGCNTVTFELT